MTDALGDKIKKGQIYGYSNRSNGIVTVIIGECVSYTEKTVTLKILKRGKSVYNDDIKHESGRSAKISCSGNSLFPLPDDREYWIVNEAKNLLME